MPYTTKATSLTPALIIYLIDVSASMASAIGNTLRLAVVMDALTVALEEMIQLSTKGTIISPRYRLAILAYSDEVHDHLGGIQPLDRIAQLGIPELEVMSGTNTAAAFTRAEKILLAELPSIQGHPAPLVCHLTDGEYDCECEDPAPIVDRIKSMTVDDGNVLVENIFISDKIQAEPIHDIRKWRGIQPDTPLKSDYARTLRDMSSVFPESFRRNVLEKTGCDLASNALMLLPGTNPELVKLGFQITTATGVVS